MNETGEARLVSVSEKMGVVESFLDKDFDEVKKYENYEFEGIPEEVEDIAKKVEKYGGRCFLEGGCVRDAVVRKEQPDTEVVTKDFDMEFYGLSSQDLLRLLKEEYGDANVMVTGTSFGVMRIKVPGSSIQLEGGIPRTDRKTGEGHKGFVTEANPSMKMAEAARRRDLTMNSLLFDPLTKTLYDPFGGVEDIKEKTIKACDLKTFVEDPLRVLRVMQFVGRFGYSVDDSLVSVCADLVADGELEPIGESSVKKKKYDFEDKVDDMSREEKGFLIHEKGIVRKRVMTERWEKGITAERLTEEVSKMLLKSIEPSRAMEFVRGIGYLDKYWPELAVLVGLGQDKEWHPEGDVWTHTLEAMNAARDILIREEKLGRITEKEREMFEMAIMTAEMLHDVGKINEKNADGQDFHDVVAEPIVAKFFSRMSHQNMRDETRRQVQVLVREHMNFFSLWEKVGRGEDVDRMVRRMSQRLSGEKNTIGANLYMLAIVSEADSRGRNPNTTSFEPVKEGDSDSAGAVAWAYEKMKEQKEVEINEPKLPTEQIISAVRSEDKKDTIWIGTVLKCLEQDVIDGIALKGDVADLQQRADQYYQVLTVLVNGRAQMENKTVKQVWGEIRKVEDPRKLLKTSTSTENGL